MMLRCLLLAVVVFVPRPDVQVNTPRPVFTDDFATDTSGDFRTSGDVAWEPGVLTLSAGASIARSIGGGWWAKIELEPDLPVPSEENPATELRVWFQLDGATPSFVVLSRGLEEGKPTSSLTLVDTGEEDGRSVAYPVRQVSLDELPTGRLTIEYRHGWVRVSVQGRDLFSGYIANGTATVAAVTLSSRHGPVAIRSLAVSATSPDLRDLTEEQRTRLDEADTANRNGVRLARTGNYQDAVRVIEEVVRVRKSLLGEQHPGLARSLDNLAMCRSAMGDYASAETAHREAVAILKATLGERHPDYAWCLSSLADLYESTGEYVQAAPLYRKSLGILKSSAGTHNRMYATCLNNLAMLYHTMGDHGQAEPMYRESLSITEVVLGKDDRQYAACLNNLAALYFETRDYERAEPLYKQAAAVCRASVGETHPSYAHHLNNLASLYDKMGDFQRAEPLFKQAGEIKRAVFGEQHPDYASHLGEMALLYHRVGDFGQAESLYRKALQTFAVALGKHHPDYARLLHNMSGLYMSMGASAKAELMNAEAVAAVRGHLDRNAIVQSERQQIRHQWTQRTVLDQRLSLAADSIASPADAVQTLWQWKGAVTMRQQAYRRVASRADLEDLFQQLQTVSQELSNEANRIPLPPSPRASDAARQAHQQRREEWRSRFFGKTQEREHIEQLIASRSGVFRRAREPLVVATVQALLPPRTAFVDFLEHVHAVRDPESGQLGFERRFIAFVVTPDRDVAVVSLDDLSAAIAVFRGPMTGRGDRSQADQAAVTLRERLWKPLERHLGGIDTVIVSPDSALGTLPFGALPGATDGSYLIERYRFATVPLAAMLPWLLDDEAPRPRAEQGLLVIGDVAYDADSTPDEPAAQPAARPAWMRAEAPRTAASAWQSLPGFQQELLVVRDHFEKNFGSSVTTLRGDAATEHEFLKQAGRCYNLHLVTHGFFASSEFEAIGNSEPDGDTADRGVRTELGADDTINQFLPGVLSGLVMAGANNPAPADEKRDDGILTASEIETMDLNAVDLVVLSACETGLGRSAGGEGLTGLQRAFHIAGARSCLASLWKVDDKATVELMSRFYRNYWELKQSKVDALRNAQLDLLRNPELTRGEPVRRENPVADAPRPARRGDPRFWAAFVLSGDWR